MSLSKEEVIKIAHLARLHLTETEMTLYTAQLSSILDFITQMDKVDTTHILPLAHPLDLAQRLRADIVNEPNLRDKFQRIAPQVEAGLYLVPKVIEEA
ncbi:MAG: asparaginyl/glutamyl-tRNA amidotransferase subunit C [Gammaproteobacteria bacterium RIFCSPHIGHO2_12_FULL_38_14]|nr:MAG: asparaginyl/glutamyl-tRNA amidotransferase subunit C [Gammaproteobacteria bacterium RIFCSPHIGHO2_12_FULL_38_14]